jgi:putative Holliday junction resolvase
VKYLALDYGQKRIGLAGSDSGLIAQPLEIISIETNEERLPLISVAINKYMPEEIVIGLPVNSDQSLSPMSMIIEKFADQLKEKFSNIKIRTINEHLSSIEAKNRSSRKAGQPIDDIAAAIILEQYLQQKDKNN